MNPIEARMPQSQAEAACYNQGVLGVLAVAKQSAEVIGAPQDKRHIPKGFASAALDELAETGAALLIGNGDASAASIAAPPAPPAPAGAIAS